MARQDNPDNYSENEPTQYADYGGSGGQAYSEYTNAGPGHYPAPVPPPTPWFQRPAALVGLGVLTAAVLALLVYAMVKFTTSGDTKPAGTATTTTSSAAPEPTTEGATQSAGPAPSTTTVAPPPTTVTTTVTPTTTEAPSTTTETVPPSTTTSVTTVTETTTKPFWPTLPFPTRPSPTLLEPPSDG